MSIIPHDDDDDLKYLVAGMVDLGTHLGMRDWTANSEMERRLGVLEDRIEGVKEVVATCWEEIPSALLTALGRLISGTDGHMWWEDPT